MAHDSIPPGSDPASDPAAWARLRRTSRRWSALIALLVGAFVAAVLVAEGTGWPVSVVGGVVVAGVLFVVALWLIERTMYAEDGSSR